MKVIGLVGGKGSGKTTSFNILKENYPVHEVMIAQDLKEFCSSLFQVPLNYFNEPALKDSLWKTPITLQAGHISAICIDAGIVDRIKIAEEIKKHQGVLIDSARKAMQYVGTDITRTFHPDFYIKKAMNRLREDEVNVVTDIRFMNEFLPFYKNPQFDFLPLLIDRPQKKTSDVHESEKHIEEIGKFCERIINDADVSVLRNRLTNSLSRFL